MQQQALKYGFLQFDSFNVDEYEHYEVLILSVNIYHVSL